MSKNITKILALATTATLFCLSPSTGITGSAGAEKATPSPSHIAPESSQRHMHHHGKDGKVRAGRHFIIEETSRLLEIEPSSLIENLKAGKTLSQLALEKKGWTEDQYVQKLVESAGRNMDKAVTDGRITDLEAQKLKEQLPTILKLKINNMDKFHE
ncbi:hypothetical protein [Paenibacillus wynnii]|uniref:Uncharacterized protein n=1 Tax=Paenibacillus wynnii TaxID=268407 RepID=A0A098M5D7_9BACL|nr:hypothetical protein [Paenibacillus wynnii]KGE16757.1 hypothetical protein PWYN_18845 [Paenibacillus wynnii]